MTTHSRLDVLCALVLMMLTGCAGSSTRFYVLTSMPAVSAAPAASPETAVAIGLYPVRLPAYLDRPEIVTRIDANRIQLAEFDQWGEPLQDAVTRILARNLSLLLPAGRVATFPQAFSGATDYAVTVDVVQLDGTLGKECTLIARWALTGKGEKDPKATGVFTRNEPAGDSYATLVAAASRLIGALAQDIATGIIRLPR